MGFRIDLKHDVFVSYAHHDDEPRRDGESGWVTEFQNQFRTRLLQVSGRKVKIWRDKKDLRVGGQFHDNIREALESTGVLICLISPSFQSSEYCKKELEAFLAAAGRESARVLPVMLYDIPYHELPGSLGETQSAAFHDAGSTRKPRPLRPRSEEFEDALDELVDAAWNILAGLESDDPKGSRFKVFMACASEDLGPSWRRLRSSLEREGFEVSGGIPPPWEPEEHAKAVEAAIVEADLSVHLLSTGAGPPVGEEADSSTYPLEQARIGLDKAKSQLFLMPDEVDLELLEDGEYARFVAHLKESKRGAGGWQLEQTGRNQMLQAILAKQKRILETVQEKAQASAKIGNAFVDFQAQDISMVGQLLPWLDERNYDTLTSGLGGPSDGMKAFEENLKVSRAFVIVFGQVDRGWVDYRLLEAQKLILSNQLKTRIGIYIPASNEAPGEFPDFFKVIRAADDLDEWLP